METTQELDWSDRLNLHSIETIETLQYKLSSWEWWIVRVSILGDNREAFVFFFPLLAGISITCGAKLLWAAILVEWSNLIMKWIFNGDRPYWWVQETPYYTNATRPVLRQFPNTCESGPGMPSGHLMMNVAIFYVFLKAVCELFVWNNNRLLSRNAQHAVSAALYAVYSTWISLVFLSRIYIQAHFIHQCVLGVMAGLLVGHISWRCDFLTNISSGLRSSFLAASLFISSVAVWMMLLQLEVDPLWSVSKALRHCYDPVHVKVDTQPYFIMARYTGAAFGLGLGLSTGAGLQVADAPGHLLRSLLACKAGVFLGRLATIMISGLPTHAAAQFLTLTVGVYAALPYTVVCTLPCLLLRLLPGATAPRNRGTASTSIATATVRKQKQF